MDTSLWCVLGLIFLGVFVPSWMAYWDIRRESKLPSPILMTRYTWDEFLRDIEHDVDIDIITEKCRRFGVPRRPKLVVSRSPDGTCIGIGTAQYLDNLQWSTIDPWPWQRYSNNDIKVNVNTDHLGWRHPFGWPVVTMSNSTVKSSIQTINNVGGSHV